MASTSYNEPESVLGVAADSLIAVENKSPPPKYSAPPTQEVLVNNLEDTFETRQNEDDEINAEVIDDLNSLKDVCNGETKCLKRSVSFPDDSDIVTGFLDPPNPWKNDKGWKTEDLIKAYRKGCEKHNTKPSNKLLQQLQCIDNVGERYEILSLKGEKLDSRQCESLEEVFRLVRFRCLDLEGTYLDDETAVAVCDMVEYYETACKLNISFNKNIGVRGWQGISKLIRKTPCLTVIDARYCDVGERVVPVLGRSLRMGCYLTRLQLQNTNLSGRALLILVAALKMNETLEELFIGDNKFMPTDGVHLGNLLKYNHTLQLLDLRSNHLQDDGVSHVCDGLAEQTLGSGLITLVLWNNQITFQAMTAINKALAASESLDTVNLGHNPITNEGIHLLKDGLLKTRSLLKLGMSGTKITCEGAIALAEVIADSPRLIRLDLQENDIKTAGLMALSLALKVNDSLIRLDIDRDTKKESGVKDYAEQQRRLQRDITSYLERNRDLAHQHDKEKKKFEAEKTEVQNNTPHSVENSSESTASEISYIPSEDKIQRPKLLFVPSTEELPFPSVHSELHTVSGQCTSPTQSLEVSLQGTDILSPQYCSDPKLTAKQLFSVNKWSSPTVTSPVTGVTYPIVVPNLSFKTETPIQLSQPLTTAVLHPSAASGIGTHNSMVSSDISESLTDTVISRGYKTLGIDPKAGNVGNAGVGIDDVVQHIPNTYNGNTVVVDSAGTLVDMLDDEVVGEMCDVGVVDCYETVVAGTGCGEGCVADVDPKHPVETSAGVQLDVQSSRNHLAGVGDLEADTNTNATCTGCDNGQVLTGSEFEAIDRADVGNAARFVNDEEFEAIESCDAILVESEDSSKLDCAVSHSNIPHDVNSVANTLEEGDKNLDADSQELTLVTDNEFIDCATSEPHVDHTYCGAKTGHSTNADPSPLQNNKSDSLLPHEICSDDDNAGCNKQSIGGACAPDIDQGNFHKEAECDSLDIEKWNTVEKSELVQGSSDVLAQPHTSTTKPDFFTSMTLNGLKQELASLIDDADKTD